MSTLDTFYNNTLTIKRRVTVTGSQTTGYSAIASGIRCIVLPVTEKEKLYNESNIGKEFDILCESDTEIRTTDRVEIDSQEYGVSGVSLYTDEFENTDTHYEIRGVLQ